jgi:hypothetical protein
MLIKVRAAQVPDAINFALVKAGLKYQGVSAIVPTQTGMYIISVPGGHRIEATIGGSGYPSVSSIN